MMKFENLVIESTEINRTSTKLKSLKTRNTDAIVKQLKCLSKLLFLPNMLIMREYRRTA